MVLVGLAECCTWLKTAAQCGYRFSMTTSALLTIFLFNKIYRKQDSEDTKTQEVTGRERIKEQKYYY